MKKLYSVALMLVCAFVLSGCMRFETKVRVKNNGKADISIVYAISKELSEMGDDDFSMELPEDDIASMEAQGWECNLYTNDNYVGYEMIKEDVALLDISKSFEASDEDSPLNLDGLSIQRKGLTYIVDWKMFEEDIADQIASYAEYFDMFGGYMSFVLELPFKASDSNATYISEDGKTLKWNLFEVMTEGIHVEFSLLNVPLIIGCMVAGACFLTVIVAAIVIAVIMKKRRAYDEKGNYNGI